ncbi:Gpi-anchored elicitin inl11b-like protein, partial [Globisporangium splendens]
MVKFTPLASLVSLVVLAASVSAHGDEVHSSASGSASHSDVVAGECNSTVSAFVTSVYTNATFFNTCATGLTFSFKTVADATSLSAADFFTFCNSSACLGPMHDVIHHAPTDCLIMYEGKAQNLTGKIIDIHHECHEVKDAAKAAAAGSHGSGHGSAASATIATPSPSTSSAASSINSKVVAVAVAGCATVASFVF